MPRGLQFRISRTGCFGVRSRLGSLCCLCLNSRHSASNQPVCTTLFGNQACFIRHQLLSIAQIHSRTSCPFLSSTPRISNCSSAFSFHGSHGCRCELTPTRFDFVVDCEFIGMLPRKYLSSRYSTGDRLQKPPKMDAPSFDKPSRSESTGRVDHQHSCTTLDCFRALTPGSRCGGAEILAVVHRRGIGSGDCLRQGVAVDRSDENVSSARLLRGGHAACIDAADTACSDSCRHTLY